MYQIIIDNHDGERYVIHDSRSNRLKVADAVCELELNKTGSLTFKIAPNHPQFKIIKKHLSEVYLLQDGEVLFCGRVLNDETDIYNFKTIICEGMLGYLLDSIQRAKAYDITGDNKIKTYLTDILAKHNAQVDDYKHFNVGNVTEVDTSETFYKISSYDDTLTTLNDDLVNTFNHTYLIPRIVNGKKYLDYLTSKQLPVNDQIIQFGKNLLTLTRTIKGEEIATAIIPLGAELEQDATTDDGKEVPPNKLTIKNIPDGQIDDDIYKKDDYIYSKKSVEKYGWIFKVLTWDGIDKDTSQLVKNAKKQLNYYDKLAKNIELNAFDLHLLNADMQSFRVGQKVRVYSSVHDMKDLDNYMIVQKMSININQPDKTTIVLGDEDRVSIDINSSASKKIDETNKSFNDYDKTFNDYDKKFNDYGKDIDDVNKKLDDFNKKYNDFDKNIDDYFDKNKGTNGYTDLSKYALKVDVQNAFDSLATKLQEV